MRVKRVEYSGSFKAMDDAGREYLIDVYTDIIDAGPDGDPHAELEATKYLRTLDGESIHRVAKGVYSTARGLRLTSADPKSL